MDPPATDAPLRFGSFELQRHERRLLLDGRVAPLGARAFDVLVALAERPGRLVDKATLMELVWPGLVVQENNLAAQVSALRKLLGDAVIATIPGRGYRFVAQLEAPPAVDGVPASVAPAVPPTAPAVPALRTNLPVELPVLFGRTSELAALDEIVERHRLVSVVGPGGVGKSLLTQHVLAARRGTYRHGVCWVELAGVADAPALPGAVAAALGIECGSGDATQALVAAVKPLTMLLALDNAEHLLADVATLCLALHRAAPGLRLLVTSQAPLHVGAEQVLRIDPLALPERGLAAAQALQFGSVALFVERVQAIDRRFALDAGNAGAVIELCHALDGLPLAIELAAARAPLLGVSRLLASMRDRFALLTHGRNRAAPERQRTLQATLEWSHGLLEAREQRVFRRLSVLAGSASLDLIEALLVDRDDDLWSVLDALDTLVDRSLVVVLAPGDGTARIEPRYRLLESARAFALQCLDHAGERAALRRRHARAVAAVLDAAYDEYFSGRIGVDDWLQQRAPDLDNAREALHWARAAGDRELQLRIGTTMLRALPPSLHDERVALADAVEACIDGHLPQPLQMKAWIELNCVLADPRKARGRVAAERALALARELDPAQPDRFALYHALARAASAAAQADDLGTARALLQELQPLEDPAWPPHRLLWGAEAVQWVARMGGDTAEALRRGHRLLALDRARGSHASIAMGNLIDAELAAGHAESAARLGTELVESLRGTRHEYSLAFACINLLAALLAQDDAARARPVAQQAWARAEAFELQHAAAAYLALLAALEGRPRAAAQLAAYSQALYAARGEAREQNETTATLRALQLARPSLDDATFSQLKAEGAALRDAEIGSVAFQPDGAS
ncbi:MAG: winged helix-turn-helix domain-containing protein [Burkholderiaceae bacterium]|nr:winged helix-turn-helix domain-containing protein [Burkholderiaceae bacterium]